MILGQSAKLAKSFHSALQCLKAAQTVVATSFICREKPRMSLNFKHFRLLILLLPIALISISAPAQVKIEGDPNIVFIYFSQKNDGGWSESHERARQKVAAELGMDIAYVENVEETTEAVRQVVDLYLDRGFNIIIGTSYGFGNGLLEAAGANPNVAFMNAAGDTMADNLETFYARTYQPWYLAGMAAGAVSKTGKIGIVAGFPISIVNWDINAYALGARAMNPDIEVIATFANTWYDPVNPAAAATRR
jgi:basic membrane lipoprotein Med (substrate-binding protein (PBP1-ABC) superfamily)